ncbi:MAG: 23S rRNA (guanosine(2251)-2'-O)-methyltransferase RlmB [Rhodobacteraceae bacterium]|nr:23S rRNA (guanosine(2251)-2'-O)-methyltransferase RlmB [Paracoccaceae bacterium]
MVRKSTRVIANGQARRKRTPVAIWLFGLHAVRDALLNPARVKLRLIVTKNAADKLADAIAASGVTPEIADPRRFPALLDPGSVHQGAVLKAIPLDWGPLITIAAPDKGGAAIPCLLLLDRVTDPHNVGAILRSAEVFGARAVIAPMWHSAPETGALAKAASGALERQPYLRVKNLSDAMLDLRNLGYTLLGLDEDAGVGIGPLVASLGDRPLAIVLGAEGPGLRHRTRGLCDQLVKIPASGKFGSLNVSNAAAVALYAMAQRVALDRTKTQ